MKFGLAKPPVSSKLDETPNQMITFTANDAKQQLGYVLDTARTAPVSITKHGRPSFVITSQEDYDSLLKLRYDRLKEEVRNGFEQLDNQAFSKRTFTEIAQQAVALHKTKLMP